MANSDEGIGKGDLATSSIVPGIRLIMAIDRQVRSCILDYALGSAILGLIPVYGRWVAEVRLLLLFCLNLKMIVNIGRFWGYQKGQDILAIIGCILAIMGSFALGFMTWVTVIAIALFVPLIDGFARAIAYGMVTWSIGCTVSRYYYSPRTLDIKALQKALQFHRSHRNRN